MRKLNSLFLVLFSLFFLNNSMDAYASSKSYEDLEFIGTSTFEDTKTRMVKNFFSHAKTYCRPNGGYIANRTSYKTRTEGSGGTKTVRLTGKISCKTKKNGGKKESKTPHTPQIQTIQNCEVVPLVDIGYISGSRHNYCLSNGWEGGHIETHNSSTKGVCWRPKIKGKNTEAACSRLHYFYHKTDGFLCEHLKDEDAKMIRACGK